MSNPKAAELMAAECLCFRVRRVSRVVTRLYDEALRPLGLQATQLTLLNAVAMGGERGAPMSRLTEVLAMDPTTLSRNLRPLERGGLIRIEKSSRDRRIRIARLTADGHDRVEEALPLWQQAHERVVEALGAEAALELRDTCDAAVEAAATGAAKHSVSPRGSAPKP